MSDLAKKARAAMKSKAQRLGSDRPLQKVDSSTFVPPEMLNADAKTGLRPISRRAFKKGGKVMGEACETRADRKPRKAGGKAGNKPVTPDNFINKNVKEANEERPGVKHIGGMKKGGRTGKYVGGAKNEREHAAMMALAEKEYGDRQKMTDEDKANLPGRKSGGRTKKAMGGPDMGDFGPGVAGAAEMMKKAGRAGVPGGGLYGAGFSKIQRGAMSPAKAVGMGAKKGGTISKHEDEAMDKALIKKMVKPSARTGRDDGGPVGGASNETNGFATSNSGMVSDSGSRGVYTGSAKGIEDRLNAKGDRDYAARRAAAEADRDDTYLAARRYAEDKMGRDAMSTQHGSNLFSKEYDRLQNWKAEHGITGLKKGGKATRKGRATGGEVFSGAGYPHKVPGVVPGGRTAKATGGKTKGKTNINIVIAAGKPAGGDMMGQQPKVPTDGRGAGGIPVPMPPAPGGMPGGGIPMPMPIPMGVPGGGPAGMPPAPAGGMPMGRKTGGRVSKIAKSYKDMTAGSGSGEGRLQKTDIAKLHKDAPSFRKGGKVYSSYKDMDAGAASGEGRLEKTEIQKRKG